MGLVSGLASVCKVGPGGKLGKIFPRVSNLQVLHDSLNGTVSAAGPVRPLDRSATSGEPLEFPMATENPFGSPTPDEPNPRSKPPAATPHSGATPDTSHGTEGEEDFVFLEPDEAAGPTYPPDLPAHPSTLSTSEIELPEFEPADDDLEFLKTIDTHPPVPVVPPGGWSPADDDDDAIDLGASLPPDAHASSVSFAGKFPRGNANPPAPSGTGDDIPVALPVDPVEALNSLPLLNPTGPGSGWFDPTDETTHPPGSSQATNQGPGSSNVFGALPRADEGSDVVSNLHPASPSSSNIFDSPAARHSGIESSAASSSNIFDPSLPGSSRFSNPAEATDRERQDIPTALPVDSSVASGDDVSVDQDATLEPLSALYADMDDVIPFASPVAETPAAPAATHGAEPRLPGDAPGFLIPGDSEADLFRDATIADLNLESVGASAVNILRPDADPGTGEHDAGGSSIFGGRTTDPDSLVNPGDLPPAGPGDDRTENMLYLGTTCPRWNRPRRFSTSPRRAWSRAATFRSTCPIARRRRQRTATPTANNWTGRSRARTAICKFRSAWPYRTWTSPTSWLSLSWKPQARRPNRPPPNRGTRGNRCRKPRASSSPRPKIRRNRPRPTTDYPRTPNRSPPRRARRYGKRHPSMTPR
ncbi:Proteophosphoglycan 5 [Fimbriiglobus ruber]|uniref:Proteophosphoglycan 5 n=1 Tax=Fimbriiglobus ruber TaxID=1908690 RepID=A0A225DNZ2_9BACT|nr:Proteophosphoglycan 5 [Fimbriiglobus ruber]